MHRSMSQVFHLARRSSTPEVFRARKGYYVRRVPRPFFYRSTFCLDVCMLCCFPFLLLCSKRGGGVLESPENSLTKCSGSSTTVAR